MRSSDDLMFAVETDATPKQDLSYSSRLIFHKVGFG
jgi:hypothetical protein